MTKTYSERLKEVDMLEKKILKLKKSKIKKSEINDELQKLQKELERNKSLIEIQDQKDEISAFFNKVHKLQVLNSKIKNKKFAKFVHRLQEEAADKSEELDDLETRQFELELPERQKDLNSLSSKMQKLKDQMELFYSTNEDNNVDVNENRQGFQGFIKNSNTSNERGLG